MLTNVNDSWYITLLHVKSQIVNYIFLINPLFFFFTTESIIKILLRLFINTEISNIKYR